MTKKKKFQNSIFNHFNISCFRVGRMLNLHPPLESRKKQLQKRLLNSY